LAIIKGTPKHRSIKDLGDTDLPTFDGANLPILKKHLSYRENRKGNEVNKKGTTMLGLSVA